MERRLDDGMDRPEIFSEKKNGSLNETAFVCTCKAVKRHQLLMDGGIFGSYILRLCSRCYSKQDKQFLIKEELVNEK